VASLASFGIPTGLLLHNCILPFQFLSRGRCCSHPGLGETLLCPVTEEAPPSMFGDMVQEIACLETYLNPRVDIVPEAPPVQLLRGSIATYFRPNKGCC